MVLESLDADETALEMSSSISSAVEKVCLVCLCKVGIAENQTVLSFYSSYLF